MRWVIWFARAFLEGLAGSAVAMLLAHLTGSLGTIQDFARKSPGAAAIAAACVLFVGFVVGWNARRASAMEEPEWHARWRRSGSVDRLVRRVPSLPRQQLAVLSVALSQGQFLSNARSNAFCLMLSRDGFLVSNGTSRYGAERRTSYSVPNDLAAALSHDRRAYEAIADASRDVPDEWGYTRTGSV